MNRLFFNIVFCLALPTALLGQVNDAGLWTSIDLQTDISKRFNVDANVELRFNENISELGTIYGETSLGYKFNKSLEFSAGYRLIGKRRLDDSYSARHRMLFNVSYRKKIKKITTTFRVRYQTQFTDINRSADWRVPEEYLRTKIAIKYDTDKKWTPFFSGESFYRIGVDPGIVFNEYRLSAGVDYDFNKKSGITLAYIFDREVQVEDPWTNYVVSLGWKYRF